MKNNDENGVLGKARNNKVQKKTLIFLSDKKLKKTKNKKENMANAWFRRRICTYGTRAE